jgi:hypothetical protein
MGGSLPNAAHDLRLCYGCHGSLDYRNRIIAKTKGRIKQAVGDDLTGNKRLEREGE